jgi:hypothetical protein
MVGADDHAQGRSARSLDELQSSMAAHIVKDPYLAIGTAREQQHLAGDGNRQDVSWRWNLLAEADSNPMTAKDSLELALGHDRIAIGKARQTWSFGEGLPHAFKELPVQHLIFPLWLLTLSPMKWISWLLGWLPTT